MNCGVKPGEILRRRHDEKIAHEQVLPGELVDEAHRQAVRLVGAGVEVLDEQLALGQVREDVRLQRGKPLARRSACSPFPRRRGSRSTVRERRTCRSASGPCAHQSGRRSVRRQPAGPRLFGWRIRTAMGSKGSSALDGKGADPGLRVRGASPRGWSTFSGSVGGLQALWPSWVPNP